MIELPDNHCYLVIRVNDKASGDKSTSIVACYSQLSKANARASDEMSAAFTRHPLSNVAIKPKGRLVEDKYFAFIEFDPSGDFTRGDRIEVKVKKLPVQQRLPTASIKVTGKINPNRKRSWSILGGSAQTDSEMEAEINNFAASIIPNSIQPRLTEAVIFAIRRRVESEINAVPVEGYLSKYEYYKSRQEDIDALVSSTNTANTFLGATLRYYRTRAKAAAITLTTASKNYQIPVSTLPVSPLMDQKMNNRRLDEAITPPGSPPHNKETGSKSPISPLSLNDKAPIKFRRSLEDIERLLADPSFKSVLRGSKMSPPPTSYDKPRSLSAIMLTPPSSRRSSKIEELDTQQLSPSPRENRFMRARTPISPDSPRRARFSSPTRNRSPRRIRSSLSPVSPKFDWPRYVKTKENTKANQGRNPVRRSKRQHKNSLDISSFESHLLAPEVTENGAQPMEIVRPISSEPLATINTSSTNVPPQKGRQRSVDDSQINLHAAKVAKTTETAHRRGSHTTLQQTSLSVGGLTGSMAGLSADGLTFSRSRVGRAMARKHRIGGYGARPIAPKT